MIDHTRVYTVWIRNRLIWKMWSLPYKAARASVSMNNIRMAYTIWSKTRSSSVDV